MLLMIDNHDSFTYNLMQYFGELKAEVKVVCSDRLSIERVKALASERIVLSLGPCTSNEASVSLVAIGRLVGRPSLLGVCLGHQSIGQALGGEAVRARQVIRGKTSPIHHKDLGVFAGLTNSLTVTRYHSPVTKREGLPECLEITAWTQHTDRSFDKITGVRHKILNVESAQFHPKPALTEQGHELLVNFLHQQDDVRGGGN